MINFSGVLPDYVDAVFPYVKDGIDKLEAKGGPSSKTVYEKLLTGNMQLMVITDEMLPLAYIVTEFPIRENGKVLRVVIAVGESMEDWLDELIDVLDQYAAQNGCESIELTGRMGWIKALKGKFKAELVYMRRKI